MSMDGVVVKCVSSRVKPTKGSAGLTTQVPGASATVCNLASATGGVSSGKLVQSDSK